MTRGGSSDSERTIEVTVDIGAPEPAGPPAPVAHGPPLPERYRDLGLLASGSFGEVRRVMDTALERAVAMKIMHPDHAGHEHSAARFLAEAKLTAGLTHPGIVAVHDWGRLADGRLWFTMREVRGHTFGQVIDELHAGPPGEDFREPP